MNIKSISREYFMFTTINSLTKRFGERRIWKTNKILISCKSLDNNNDDKEYTQDSLK